jgi:hypothetical protein
MAFLILLLSIIAKVIALYFIFTTAPVWVTTPLTFYLVGRALGSLAVGIAVNGRKQR